MCLADWHAARPCTETARHLPLRIAGHKTPDGYTTTVSCGRMAAALFYDVPYGGGYQG